MDIQIILDAGRDFKRDLFIRYDEKQARIKMAKS